jgi:hypothetical protein
MSMLRWRQARRGSRASSPMRSNRQGVPRVPRTLAKRPRSPQEVAQ